MGKAVGWTFVMLVLFTNCRTVQSNYANRGFLRASEPTEQFPFQVLHADSSRIVGTESFLARLDYVAADDFIKVKNGHLILVHYSGKFLEFEKDTILNISESNERLKESLHLSVDAGKYRPDIEMIFTKEFFASGAMCSPMPSLEFVGDSYETSEARSDNICVAWLDINKSQNAPYVISVRNIFDEIVTMFETYETMMDLDLSHYDSALSPGLAIIQVVSKNDDEISTYPMGVRLVEDIDYIPTICKVSSAIEALEFASYLKWNHFEYHTTYFTLASELSDKKIYEELKQLNVR